MKLFSTAGAVLLASLAATAGGIKFDPEDEASMLSATKQYAYGLMSLYKNNETTTAKEDIGILPQPYYWWEAGAMWGSLVEFSQFTGDESHVKTIQQALTANYGPENDFILSYRKGQTGNDDQAFWALAVMSALEYQFPDPADAPADYLEVAINAFENIVGRWDETSCGGGLKWQIYPENSYGYNYKNAISNGATFALGARLARYTGEQKYADWSVKIYDWTKKVGLISDTYEVFDGTDDKTNCPKVADETQWTYNNAMFLHGSAFMYDYTNGDSTWKTRVSGFMDQASLIFIRPFENATDIMYEWACETGEFGRHCNLDQQSFKAYLSRFMAKTAMLAPFTKSKITGYLKASAVGAAKSCSGGADGTTCGSKWYTGGWDGTSGVGQQMSALEVTQALLMIKKGTLPAKKNVSKPSASESSSVPTSTAVESSTAAPYAPSSQAVSSQVPSPSTTGKASSSDVVEQAPTSDMKSSSETAAASSSDETPSTKTPEASEVPVSTVVASSVVLVTSTISPLSTGKPAGEFDEKSTWSTSCTPSVTTTVYMPGISTAAPALPSTFVIIGPSISTTSTTMTSAAPPANTTTPTSSSLPDFQGAASSVRTFSNSVMGIFVAVVVSALV
ncbi:hypothetical protein BDW02DRAFT_526971 [Decorospora gaudefroyi]|uniref:mannan endo-1,6-alpha-mannosidase n=1 Tax=Decorospora gaudefroyi TaxID=184978 RepID=A0A6A5KC97_9PLEO|nr:hypothetical protein BDW02DRAFT_526971 [Decorospora gaudefroyi]